MRSLAVLASCCLLSIAVNAADDLAKYPFHTGFILPTPQKVEYGIGSLKLYDINGKRASACVIAGGDANAADLRDDVVRRIQCFGGELPSASAGYENVLLLGTLEGNPIAKGLADRYGISIPDRGEGYVLKLIRDGGKNYYMAIGRDALGSLWAAQSLRQLVTVRDGHVVLDAADAYDFPMGPRYRSYIMPGALVQFLPLDYLINFTTVYKYNALVVETRLTKKADLWRQMDQAGLEEMVKPYRPLVKSGVKVIHQISFCRGEPEQKIAISDEADMAKALAIVEFIFKEGMDANLLFDDSTFPMNPKDVAAYGDAASVAHAKLVNRIFKDVLARYPGRELSLCPPFYMNPNPWLKLPEDHCKHLNFLRDNTPGALILNWCGPLTTSSRTTASDIRWWKENAGHRILYYDNAFHGGHSGQYDGWYYFETFDFQKRFPNGLEDIYVYMICTGGYWCGPCEALVANVSDYLWNPEAYKNPSESLRRSIAQVAGPEAVETCLKWRGQICRFDPYVYRPNLSARRMLPHFNVWYKEMEDTVAELKRKSANPYLPMTLAFFDKVLKNKLIDEAAKLPEKAACVKVEGGVSLAPEAFSGGVGYCAYAEGCPSRNACWIYGREAGACSELSSGFELDAGALPASQTLSLIIEGQNIPVTSGAKVRVAITLNGQKLYEGVNGCVEKGWSAWEIPFKREMLKEPGANVLKIANLEESQPECFMVAKVTLKASEPQAASALKSQTP